MRKTVLLLACVLLAPVFLVGITASAPYDPWSDLGKSHSRAVDFQIK